MISEPIRAEIMARIRKAESEHGVRMLLAVESGSRAWGFESPNSDYDVRFIYAHPADWYLSINLEDKRDVIEYPIVDDIDINGWDLRKALRLFARSNPAIVEWIQSPIIYLENGSLAESVRQILPSTYSCLRGIYHYLHMAKTNYRGYLKADLVPRKKYLYVLRALLAVRWLQKYGKPAPVEFDRTLHLIDDQPALLADIKHLLDIKRTTPEMGLEPPIMTINTFIEQEFERLAHVHIQETPSPLMDRLNELFRTVLRE